MKFTAIQADVPEQRRTRRQFRDCREEVKGEFFAELRPPCQSGKQGGGPRAVWLNLWLSRG